MKTTISLLPLSSRGMVIERMLLGSVPRPSCLCTSKCKADTEIKVTCSHLWNTSPPHYTSPSTLHQPLHITPAPPHYTSPSTLHQPLHITPAPPYYTSPSTLHQPLHITPGPPHYTSPSTLHQPLHITPAPPHYTSPSTLHIATPIDFSVWHKLRSPTIPVGVLRSFHLSLS